MLNLFDNLTIDEEVLDLAIIQGKTYQLLFHYPADLTMGEVRGEIRNKYLENNGALVASFDFHITYDALEGKSLVLVKLEALETALITSTKYQGVGEPSVRNSYVYDVEYEENGTVIELLRGFVQVKPEVTV